MMRVASDAMSERSWVTTSTAPGYCDERVLEHLLAGEVQVMRRLVEQQQVRGLEQDARQRDALALAARQHAARA